MTRHTAAWWAKRVDEVALGGSVPVVARRHGVSERTLKWWRSELRRRASLPEAPEAPRLLPVTVTAVPARSEPPELEVVVELGAARVTLRGAVRPEHLGALIAGARPC
ncbi:MAG: transposase [Gemmatimonadetes bacterium]|nr:transposase [Gemmatimonadota bacterium]MBM4270517.1 transposase [Deltaproteobacteria bacterium]